MELKACPFCGAYPKQRSVKEDYHTVWCDNDDCPDRPEILGETMQSAIDSWNTRPIEDTLRAELNYYKEVADGLYLLMCDHKPSKRLADGIIKKARAKIPALPEEE